MARVTPQYVSEQMPLDHAPLQNAREVATFFALPAGDFVVMPNSVQHREGKFLLRILADQHADVWEINEDNLVVHSISTDFGDERTVEYVSINLVSRNVILFCMHKYSKTVSTIFFIGFFCSFENSNVYFTNFVRDIHLRLTQHNCNISFGVFTVEHYEVCERLVARH